MASIEVGNRSGFDGSTLCINGENINKAPPSLTSSITFCNKLDFIFSIVDLHMLQTFCSIYRLLLI